MKFDPWHTPDDMNDPDQVVTVIARGSSGSLGLPFILAEGPGDEIVIEYKKFLRNTRITYRMKSGELYRIVQNEFIAENQSDPADRINPIATYRGNELRGLDKSEGLAPWSAVWWDQAKLDEVEIASETISMTALVKIAETIIDNAK
ncbi:MAG: hypothetical protein H0W86_00185 [Armatimonadetes bacterium]|nr:hypothetical protein [Armatimonadota bacterium]